MIIGKRFLEFGELAGVVLASTIVVLTAPIWLTLLGVAKAEDAFIRWRDRRGPRVVFAFWPVKCDPWPDEGFSGWVWLETVWRDVNNPGWTRFRREPPKAAQHAPDTREASKPKARATELKGPRP